MTIGDHIIHLHQVDSTNSYLKENARELEEGVVVWADLQTGGKGRRGRSWFATTGSLTFSVLLRPQLTAQDLLLFTLLPAVSVVKVLRASDVNVVLKWPNDLLLNGKKMGGVLVETCHANHGFPDVIVGMGLNLHQRANEFPPDLQQTASSVLKESGMVLDSHDLFARLLVQMDKDYRQLQTENDLTVIKREWLRFCGHLQQEVIVRQGERQISGKFVGISDRGGAQVVTEAGIIEITNVTDFSLRLNHVTGD